MRHTISAALGLAGLALAATPAAAEKTVTVTGKEFKFEPDQITLEAGETLVIEFENQGNLSHNLTLKNLDTGTETVQSGSTQRIEVQPEPGTYSFICTVPGHEAAGMTGELVVER